MRDAMRKGLRLCYSKEMAEIVEGTERHGFTEQTSDAELDAWLKKNVFTGLHICGTCKMGAKDDVNFYLSKLWPRGHRGVTASDP